MTEVLARAAPRPAARAGTRSLIVRDAYQDGRYVFTGADLAARAASVGLVPKGDLIWYQAGTRLRPYGYPTVFVPNIAHQHLLVLRGADARGRRRRRAQGWPLRRQSSVGARGRRRRSRRLGPVGARVQVRDPAWKAT